MRVGFAQQVKLLTLTLLGSLSLAFSLAYADLETPNMPLTSLKHHPTDYASGPNLNYSSGESVYGSVFGLANAESKSENVVLNSSKNFFEAQKSPFEFSAERFAQAGWSDLNNYGSKISANQQGGPSLDENWFGEWPRNPLLSSSPFLSETTG